MRERLNNNTNQSASYKTVPQIIARKTNGIVTPANAVTVAGLALTALGCREYVKGNKRKALGVIAAGAACDAIDGATARATGTSGYRFGQSLDAVTDGVKSVMCGKALYNSGVYSGGELLANYGPKMAGWAANTVKVATGRGDTVKTSSIGRVAEVVRWLGPGLAAASSVVSNKNVANKLSRASKVSTVAACTLGLVAAAGYIKELVQSSSNES